MLLYRTAQGRYLAVNPQLQFAAVNGYEPCFGGQDVPDVICRAFIKESGGFEIQQADCVELGHRPSRASTLAAKIPLH